MYLVVYNCRIYNVHTKCIHLSCSKTYIYYIHNITYFENSLKGRIMLYIYLYICIYGILHENIYQSFVGVELKA